MTTVTRPTLLLKCGDRVFIQWRKGTVRGHSSRTGRYMIEVDDYPGIRLHQKYIYRNRNELIKMGGE